MKIICIGKVKEESNETEKADEAEIAKEENKGKGDREIYTALVNGKDDLFVNPNAPMPIVGGGNPPPQNQIDENAARAVMGLPPLAK